MKNFSEKTGKEEFLLIKTDQNQAQWHQRQTKSRSNLIVNGSLLQSFNKISLTYGTIPNSIEYLIFVSDCFYP